jgi:hypothetical protein
MLLLAGLFAVLLAVFLCKPSAASGFGPPEPPNPGISANPPAPQSAAKHDLLWFATTRPQIPTAAVQFLLGGDSVNENRTKWPYVIGFPVPYMGCFGTASAAYQFATCAPNGAPAADPAKGLAGCTIGLLDTGPDRGPPHPRRSPANDDPRGRNA